jgi:poly(glycerol-phosphate) alpha-glucosyltransferase
MKVAITTGSLSRNAGGLFESVRALGKGLAKLGGDVSVYGLRDQNWERDEEAWAPLSAHAFSFIGPRAFAWSPDMDAALDEARPDLVALQGLWQYASLSTCRQWRRKGTPYVVSPRGMLDKWALANSRWKKVLAAFAFENAVLRDAACLHALCVAEADAIRAYGLRQRIEVVPNGVELPEKLTTEGTEGKKKLLFLGRIHPKKGLIGALRAWADIRNSASGIPNSQEWQFVIAGWDQGGHEAELKMLCAELGLRIASCELSEDLKLNSYKLKTSALLPDVDVVFFGPAFGEEKEALLRSAEAFILPSFSEGLPMSVLEAWAYGLPVLMTPECNLPEGFSSGAGLEIRSGEGSFQSSDFSFQHGLRALLEMSDAERAAMGMRGRRLVEKRFTWPKVSAQMRQLYEELLGR